MMPGVMGRKGRVACIGVLLTDQEGPEHQRAGASREQEYSISEALFYRGWAAASTATFRVRTDIAMFGALMINILVTAASSYCSAPFVLGLGAQWCSDKLDSARCQRCKRHLVIHTRQGVCLLPPLPWIYNRVQMARLLLQVEL